MNKKLIAMAVAGACTAPLSAQAVEFSTSGFADITYTLIQEACDNPDGSGGTIAYGDPVNTSSTCSTSGTDVDGSAANSGEQKFADNGEIDFMATENDVTLRMDVDLTTTSASLEQIFFSWAINDGVALRAGTFNNPVGWEAEDVTGMYQVTHGQIYKILDSQTYDAGNNVTGAAVDFGAGPANITLGLLQEIGGGSGAPHNEAMSFLANVNGDVMDGLNLELGFLSQEDNTALNTGSLESLVDFNATWTMGGWTVAGEILTAGKVVDNSFGLMGNYDFGNGWGATARYDVTSFEDSAVDDQNSLTLYGSWAPTDNLSIGLEWREDDNGGSATNSKEDQLMLEFIATIGG